MCSGTTNGLLLMPIVCWKILVAVTQKNITFKLVQTALNPLQKQTEGRQTHLHLHFAETAQTEDDYVLPLITNAIYLSVYPSPTNDRQIFQSHRY